VPLFVAIRKFVRLKRFYLRPPVPVVSSDIFFMTKNQININGLFTCPQESGTTRPELKPSVVLQEFFSGTRSASSSSSSLRLECSRASQSVLRNTHICLQYSTIQLRMMDPLGASNFLTDGDAFNQDFDKIDADFDASDFNVDQSDIDDLLGEEGEGSAFNLNDSDFQNLMHSDELLLDSAVDGSAQSFVDRLRTMPIVEVDHLHADAVVTVDFMRREENGSMQQPQNNTQALNIQDTQPDPLWGSLNSGVMGSLNSGGMMPQQAVMQQHSMLMQQQTMMQQSAPQDRGADALQSMIDQAINDSSSEDNMMMHQMGAEPEPVGGGVDLEEEKMKLLSRLSEIQQRQSHSQTRNSRMPQSTNNMFLQNNNTLSQVHAMPNISNFLQMQQQQQQQKNDLTSTGVASIGGMGGESSGGETPLTSFLRGGRKQQPAASRLSQKIGGAPRVANIFSEPPMEFDNPLLRSSRSKNQLFGAMNRSDVSTEMVKQLSARSLMARSDSSMKLTGGGQGGSSSNRNATWGDGPRSGSSFKSSGILPKHASENHLLRQAKGGLVRSRSKPGFISRENSIYSNMKKNNSRNQLSSEDTLGELLPRKRRSQGVGAKHKLGKSRSVPHTMMNNSSKGGGSSTSNGYQKNFMW
jgi:hypothetical protein